VTTTAAASGSFPTTSGTKFVIDGKPGYYAGTNSYWIGFLTNNSDIDLVMQHLASSGLKILRVWGFNDVTTTPADGTVYFQSFANGEATINTGANGLQRLDYVVKSAEAHGIKLIINFVNNWTDYGGMAAYFSYAGITSNTQWYNSTIAQTQYQKYIKAVVSRYINSPAIFAWELANEPRCTGCDLSTLKTWVITTSKYIKSIDGKHMVTTGEEGFGPIAGDDGSYPYQLSAGGSNFTANCEVPTIDFCTYHLYPESWSVTPTLDWGNQWIKAHAKACSAVGKPCLLEEFGASNNCTIESSWQATALAAAGTGGDLFWQYGDTLSYGKTSQDGNTAYYGDELYTCLVTNHIKAIDSL
jgi:mannan endo-1,4-beta-mannosidase